MSALPSLAADRPIRVLVLEESSFRREGAHNLLQRYASLDVVMATHDVAEGLRMASRRPPDVVLVNMDQDAARIVREVKQRQPHARVIALLPSSDPGVARTLRNAGADELVFGVLRAATLVDAIFRQVTR
ncbi:hypothetical protein M2650_05410 [Luteimonas sp. SX5]|uniref:Response regulatory domain-containing protein n=1 Tax=Luteimonas galliterrae TaxID=2940486 RepID=A0ABT0MIJ2_9GAMM|nr:hypothetical protein [Luteimonas galliterrae]MCL1634069.1 hypothetical protein [Luteimonas galliterrae]